MKISFKNDYSEGAHPRILKTLIENNNSQQEGYGLDYHCLSAASLLREKMKASDAAIYFLTGGTQTNLIAIAAFFTRMKHAFVPQADMLPPMRQGPLRQQDINCFQSKQMTENLRPSKLPGFCNNTPQNIW